MPKQGKKSVSCPVEATLDIIGKKWTILVIRDLLTGTKRWNELAARSVLITAGCTELTRTP